MSVESAKDIFQRVLAHFHQTKLDALWRVTQDADGDTRIVPKSGLAGGILTPDGVPGAELIFVKPKIKPWRSQGTNKRHYSEYNNDDYDEPSSAKSRDYGTEAVITFGSSSGKRILLCGGDVDPEYDFGTLDILSRYLMQFFKPKSAWETAILLQSLSPDAKNEMHRQSEKEEVDRRQRAEDMALECFMINYEKQFHALYSVIAQFPHTSERSKAQLKLMARSRLGLD